MRTPRLSTMRPRGPAAVFVATALLATALLAAALVGCGPDKASSVEAPDGAADPIPAPSARRPTRRFYLARTPERCEIFAEDGETRTEPFVTPCPEYMLTGERIRIAGRTCMLDNKAQPEREKPVVCPDPLTHFEKRERGEEK